MAQYVDVKIGGSDTSAPLNVNKRISLMLPFLKPGISKLLDCGCGAGEYVHTLRIRYQIDAWGVEYSEDKVHKAKLTNPSSDKIVQGDVEQLCFADESFDIVLINEVLEHVPNEKKALSEIRRVLRPGGLLIIFSPNRWYPFETHGVYLKQSVKTLSPWIPFIPYIPLSVGEIFFDYWARNYWPNELKQLVEKQGYTVINRSFVWQTFENLSGSQPFIIRRTKTLLRYLANSLEKSPVLKQFGVSQLIIATKI